MHDFGAAAQDAAALVFCVKSGLAHSAAAAGLVSASLWASPSGAKAT